MRVGLDCILCVEGFSLPYLCCIQPVCTAAEGFHYHVYVAHSQSAQLLNVSCCNVPQAMAELVAENARSSNPARTPQELAVALLQGGTPREAVETRLPGLVSTLFGRSGSAGATQSAGEP